MKTMLLSSLAKVFPDEEPKNPVISSFSMLKNEKKSFQLAFCAEEDKTVEVKINSPLEKAVSAFRIGFVPSKLPKYKDSDDFYLRDGRPGLYPDILYPLEAEGMRLQAKKGEWQSLWFELAPADSFAAGDYSVEIILDDDVKENVNIKILGLSLPEQELICTMWFHTDCLMTWYGFEAFSEEYWRTVENFAECAVEHGINFLLTPLFTPPLDTEVGGERPTVQLVDVNKDGENYTFGFEKLERWVDMCDRAGIKYFEMSHLFSQWGAVAAPKIMATENGEHKMIFGWDTEAAGEEYTAFLTQFAAALIKFIDAKGIRERCVFHASDEPNLFFFASYEHAVKLVNSLFGDFKIIDALSDFRFYEEGLVKTPIPSNDRIEAFIGRVPELWTYYCCGQHKGYVSNRFFAIPSQRNRVLGWQMYKYGLSGFLQWGFNFWYAQLSKRPVNPFEESDAGEAFPSGCAYVTYPGEGGRPLVSLRLKVFYDALQDMRALKLLERKIGKDAVVEIIENNTAKPITFSEYPHEEEWIINKREEINRILGGEKQ